jgi:hypothetical protein
VAEPQLAQLVAKRRLGPLCSGDEETHYRIGM